MTMLPGNSRGSLASSQTNEQATGLMAGAAVLGEALASVKAAVVRSQLLLRSP